MRRFCVLLVVFCVSIASIAADSTPQIAFRFLDDYITEKEEGPGTTTAGIFALSVGTALLAGSGVAWYFGDDISAAVSEDGQPWDLTTKSITTGALAAGGGLSIGTGLVLLLMPPHDYRAEYAHIYGEDDPLLREAFSAAALKRLSEDGRIERLLSGWTDLSIPIVTVFAQVSANLSAGKPWHEEVLSVSSTQIWQIATGISEIFFKRSEEEILFEEYLAAQRVIRMATR